MKTECGSGKAEKLKFKFNTRIDSKFSHTRYVMHVYCPCILRMFMWRSKKVFRACEVFIIFVILLIEMLFREPAARRCDQSIAGGRGAGGAASVQAEFCGRLLQSWPWSSVAAGNWDTLAFSNLCIAMGYILYSALPFPSSIKSRCSVGNSKLSKHPQRVCDQIFAKQQSWFAMWFPAYQWRGWILNLS